MTEKQADYFILLINVVITIPCIYLVLAETYGALPAIVNMLFSLKTLYGIKRYITLKEMGVHKQNGITMINHALFRFF